jgi:hypothetical protein
MGVKVSKADDHAEEDGFRNVLTLGDWYPEKEKWIAFI